ncbi:hypothetical protein EC968_007865 [Mortierella alpina]|nr:hypothetical protein EC968_007865 [Mortierella alpina]
MEKFIVYMLETARLLTHPQDEACVIFDLRGCGLKVMDIGISRVIHFYAYCMRYYYPESVGHCVILDPGRAFQGIWKVVRGWANPRLVSRIQFARTETDLFKYVDADHLLDTFGGKVQSEITDYVGAVEGENDQMKDTTTRDRLQQTWRAHLWKLEALLRERVGCQESETEDARAETVVETELEQVAEDIRAAYMRMRPYICAQTVFDRRQHRPLQDDGTVEWTYPRA